VFYNLIKIVLLLNILRFPQQYKWGVIHVTPENGGYFPFKNVRKQLPNDAASHPGIWECSGVVLFAVL
jgi:hypothetical protein